MRLAIANRGAIKWFRRFALLFFLVGIGTGPQVASAQVAQSKQIYLWDVTLSMEYNGIWSDVKVLLKKSLAEIRDQDTEVIIIPFQDDVFETKRARVGNPTDLEALYRWIDNYEIPKGKHNTNICRAMERAEDFILGENIDVVILMTDGDHEPPVDPVKARQYPMGCVQEYLEGRWCSFAMELDAYLVYYHLLGAGDSEIQEYTEASCRAVSVHPSDGNPVQLHFVTPQLQSIVVDQSFISTGRIDLPTTTSLPLEVWKTCKFGATLQMEGKSFPLVVKTVNGAISMTLNATSEFARSFPAVVDEGAYKGVLNLEMEPLEDILVVLTADQIPFHFHHYEQRWFEIKTTDP